MSRERDSFNEINITPLTDIFLVLLIIMMVIAPLLDQQGLNLTVPDMVEQTQVKESKTLTVAVTNDDKYIIDGQEIPAQELGSIIKDKSKKVLVIATSSIECGVNISFDVGWREKCGPLNLFQCMGRINRGSISPNAVVYVYSWDSSLIGKNQPFTKNPQLNSGIQVFDNTQFENLTPSYCTELVRNELSITSNGMGQKLLTMEENRQFTEVEENFKVINNITATIIIDKELVKKIENNEPVLYSDIVRNSIQLWFTKIQQLQTLLNLKIITDIKERDYYVWESEYDNCSGIGKVMLTLR